MEMKSTLFIVLPTHHGGMDYTGDVYQRWESWRPPQNSALHGHTK